MNSNQKLPKVVTATGGTSSTTKGFFPAAQTASARDVAYIWSSLFAGVGSGALASVVCAPLDLLRTRMQVWGDVASQQKGAASFLRDVGETQGWKGYFRGLGATLATVPLFWGLYFPLYNDLKRVLGESDSFENQAVVHCVSAISAGAVADVICNPMFVVRTRLQTEALHAVTNGGSNNSKPLSITQTIKLLYREGGLRIFWRGLTASMLGLSHVGVQFPVYEWLKQEARLRHGHQETPLDLLVASGLSKMTAAILTYPHEVIRSRMMDARHAADASFVATTSRVWQHEGLRGFYSGLHVSLVRVVPNCCVTFLTYEMLLRFASEQLEQSRKKGF